MDIWDKLRLHTDALATAVDADSKFFASIVHYVKQLQELVHSPRPDTSAEELKLLADRIEAFFKKWRPSGTAFYIPPRQASDADPTVKEILALANELSSIGDQDFDNLKRQRLSIRAARQSADPLESQLPCAFIGHGRSSLWARVKLLLEDELDLATVTYESESRVGESIVPLLEKMLDQATFAVLVLTAEDETASGSLRARQNVIHEAGLFQGRLGFRKAVLLKQDGVEEFSNVAGLQHIPFAGESVEQAFYELQRVLKREGQI